MSSALNEYFHTIDEREFAVICRRLLHEVNKLVLSAPHIEVVNREWVHVAVLELTDLCEKIDPVFEI